MNKPILRMPDGSERVWKSDDPIENTSGFMDNFVPVPTEISRSKFEAEVGAGWLVKFDLEWYIVLQSPQPDYGKSLLWGMDWNPCIHSPTPVNRDSFVSCRRPGSSTVLRIVQPLDYLDAAPTWRPRVGMVVRCKSCENVFKVGDEHVIQGHTAVSDKWKVQGHNWRSRAELLRDFEPVEEGE